MPEETKKEEVVNPQPKSNPEADTAEIIKSLKAKVDSLTKENENLEDAKKRYYDAVLNGGLDQKIPEKKHRPVEEIRKDLIDTFKDDKEVTNLDYCKLVLELDEAVRKDTGESVFLPKGHGVVPTQDEYATAEKMHDTLKECIDESQGDPTLFNAQLKNRIK